MTFEEIINTHNDNLMEIFSASEVEGDMSFSQMSTLGQKVTELNKRTENELARLFDKSFLQTAKIESEKE